MKPAREPHLRGRRAWRHITRDEAVTVACPRCGSAAGRKCRGKRNPSQERKAPHLDRFRHFMRGLLK
jgi:hypothetical protein